MEWIIITDYLLTTLLVFGMQQCDPRSKAQILFAIHSSLIKTGYCEILCLTANINRSITTEFGEETHMTQGYSKKHKCNTFLTHKDFRLSVNTHTLKYSKQKKKTKEKDFWLCTQLSY